jgi:hypothetical protein
MEKILSNMAILHENRREVSPAVALLAVGSATADISGMSLCKKGSKVIISTCQ